MLLLLLSNQTASDLNKETIDELFINWSEINKKLSGYFKDAVSYKIEDLFEINYGLSEQRYHNITETKKQGTVEISFLRMNSVREEDGKIELSRKAVQEKTNPEKSTFNVSKNKKKLADKLIIPENFLLEKDDLLINTRGVPKLISLSGIELENDVKYVANQNFITLRPRKTLLHHLHISETFLHSMLNSVVENVFKKKYEEQELIIKEELEKNIRQKIPKRSVASSISSVKIDDVKKEKILVPHNSDAQNNVFATIENLENLKKLIDSKVKLWKTEIFNQINDNQ
jgi:hypothetical protein